MVTVQIPWNDGTSDKITLTFSEANGNQSVVVSTDDNNTYLTREKTITFSTTAGGSKTAVLRVVQTAADLIVTTDNDVATSDNDVVLGD